MFRQVTGTTRLASVKRPRKFIIYWKVTERLTSGSETAVDKRADDVFVAKIIQAEEERELSL